MEPVLSSGSLFRDLPPAPPELEPEPEPEVEEPAIPVDDIEVPAFLRRERRMYQ